MPQRLPPRPYVSLNETMKAPPAVGPWPGTTTQTNLDWEKQQQDQMAQALQGMNTLVSQAEAQQFARQQEAQQAQSQYLAAANAPIVASPALSMALPYAAAQFSSALSGQPQVGAQADQSLALNRTLQLQRRSQVLDQLAAQNQEAARRAQDAGDLTNALKFNTKANLLMKQLEEASTSITHARETAQDQSFKAWQSQLDRTAEYRRSLLMRGAQDPALAARLNALENVYRSNVKSIQDELDRQIGSSRSVLARRAELQSQRTDLENAYTSTVEHALIGQSIAPPPVVAPTAAPAAAPSRFVMPQRPGGGGSAPAAGVGVGAPVVVPFEVRFARVPRDTVMADLLRRPVEQRKQIATEFGLTLSQMMTKARQLPNWNPKTTLTGK